MAAQEDEIKQSIYAPMTGDIIPIAEVPDPTFSEKMMGDGVAIEPQDGEVRAPVDGEIVQLFPTKHAIGIRSQLGVEVLIHIGLETVGLDGQGFEAHVQQGEYVKKGDLLITIDLKYIRKHAESTISPIVITNSNEWTLTETENAQVKAGQSLLLEAVKVESTSVKPPEETVKKSVSSSIEYGQEALDIVAAVGGEDNIRVATHCVSRLRFALSDEDKVDLEELENVRLVKGSFSANGQFQVVIGQGTVDKVYDAIMKETGLSEATKEDVKNATSQKQNFLQRGIKVLADIFIPILPAIVMAGLLLGLHNILDNPVFGEQSVVEKYPQWAGLADMIDLIANTAFTFLPALIGWSASKRFGGNPLLGVVLGLVMVHPDLMPASDFAEEAAKGDAPTWNLFGLEVNQMGYQNQVLPMLFATWVLVKIELWLKKHVMDTLQLLVVAPVALLITGFLAFIVIGPVTFTIGNWITTGVVSVFQAFPIIGGLLYGAIYAPLVITGMHHTFLAVDLQLIGSTGSTFLWPVLALSNIAQGSAVFAIMLATKDDNLKGLAGPSGISAWLGVTEPAMFGVNLRYKYPFVAAMIGTSIAAAYITFQHVLATSVGVGGVPGFLSIQEGSWVSFFIGMLIVIIVPFIITYMIAKRKFNVQE